VVVVTRRPASPRRGADNRATSADKPTRTPADKPTRTAAAKPVRRPGVARAVTRSVLPDRLRLPVMRPLTAIGITVAVVTLLLAPYLQPWWAQRSQLNAARQQVTDLQHEVDDLTAQSRRWQDPSFVKAQARGRLHYVMPGEISYVLLDDGPAVAADPRQAAGSLPETTAGQPWYSTVWQSLQAAGSSSGSPPSGSSSSGSPSSASKP
jgi:cell division protein FtsB